MHIFDIDEIVSIARTKSPFYRALYTGLPSRAPFESLPLVDPTAFWKAHAEDRSNILTGPLVGGIVMNSGGTTGSPKFSYYTRSEYESGMETSALAFEATGLKDGQKVANLFPAGDLYGAYLTATGSLQKLKIETVHFPFGFLSTDDFVLDVIGRFGIDAVAGMPSRLFKLLLACEGKNLPIPLEYVLFAGEPFFQEQINSARRIFPELKFRSLGYASIDAGIIGYSTPECGPGEHFPFRAQTIVEIVDEAGQPIDETDAPGSIVVTNLTRTLMPIVRYPTGDRAQWLEPPRMGARRFQLLGRGREAARVADVNIFVDDIGKLLRDRPELKEGRPQLVVDRRNGLDYLTIRVAREGGGNNASLEKDLIADLLLQQPVLEKMIEARIIGPITVQIGTFSELVLNPRTGKAPPVMDRRFLTAATA